MSGAETTIFVLLLDFGSNFDGLMSESGVTVGAPLREYDVVTEALSVE